MPYKGVKHTFPKDPPSNANIRAEINKALTPAGGIPNPEVAILCDHDGTVVIIHADSLPVVKLGTSYPVQVRYVYKDDDGGAASDPCVYYVAGGNLEKVCW